MAEVVQATQKLFGRLKLDYEQILVKIGQSSGALVARSMLAAEEEDDIEIDSQTGHVFQSYCRQCKC